MTKREVASLACRLLGVYVVVFSLVQVPGILWGIRLTRNAGQAGWVWLSGAGPVVVGVVLGVLLWLFAGRLASAMVSETTGVPARITAGAREFLLIGFALIGLFLLADAIPTICRLLANLIGMAASQDASAGAVFWTQFFASQRWNLGEAVAQIAIGLVLLFWPRKLALFAVGRQAQAPSEDS